MDLNEMLVFAGVARTGSFTTAAKELGMPKSTVSRKVSELEERLKARLLQRTTRKLSLTDAGRIYYDYSARIVGEIEDAERAVSSLQAIPRGLLRVTTPLNAAFLAPIVSDFLKRYPEVELELLSTGRTVDLVEERFDVGIRAGMLLDSTLIGRTLGTVTWLLVAAPTYLKRRKRPRSPEDLKEHAFILFGAGPRASGIRLENAEKSVLVAVSARLLASEMDLLRATVNAGLGIGLLPAFLCVDDVRAGRMERVLHEWSAPPTPVHVVYPSTRHLSPKVKSFVDHLHERMTPPPWEVEGVP